MCILLSALSLLDRCIHTVHSIKVKSEKKTELKNLSITHRTKETLNKSMDHDPVFCNFFFFLKFGMINVLIIYIGWSSTTGRRVISSYYVDKD